MPPPGDLPNSEMEPASLKSPALAGRLFIISATWGVPFDITKESQPETSPTPELLTQQGP